MIIRQKEHFQHNKWMNDRTNVSKKYAKINSKISKYFYWRYLWYVFDDWVGLWHMHRHVLFVDDGIWLWDDFGFNAVRMCVWCDMKRWVMGSWCSITMWISSAVVSAQATTMIATAIRSTITSQTTIASVSTAVAQTEDTAFHIFLIALLVLLCIRLFCGKSRYNQKCCNKQLQLRISFRFGGTFEIPNEKLREKNKTKNKLNKIKSSSSIGSLICVGTSAVKNTISDNNTSRKKAIKTKKEKKTEVGSRI